MTAEPTDDSDVIVYTPEQLREAVKNALAFAGCTAEQLRAQAATGDFASGRARKTWPAATGLARRWAGAGTGPPSRT